MNRTHRTRLLVLFVLSGLLLTACGKDSFEPAIASTIPRPTSKAEFLRVLIAATRSGDPERIRTLVHPATLRGIDHSNEWVFQELFAREVRRSMPDDPSVTITQIAPDAPLPFEGSFIYPVRPNVSVQIEFEEAPVRHVTMRREVLVDDDGVWWLVFPIPTLEMTAQLKKARAAAEATDRTVRTRVAEMEASLRDKLEALLRDGRKIDAIKRYREASGQGLRVAKAVVEALQADLHSGEDPPPAAAR